MARFSGHCGNTDVRVGHQDTDKGVPEHVRVKVSDTRFIANSFDDGCIAVWAKGPSMIITDHKMVARKRLQGIRVFAAFLSIEFCQLAPSSCAGISIIHSTFS